MTISWKNGELTRDDDTGPKADTAASTDTGTFSLISLFKRLLQKITAGLPIAGADGLTPASAANPVPGIQATQTVYRQFAGKARTANATGSFPSKVPTETAPTGTGVIAMGTAGSLAPSQLQLVPYGQGTAGQTFDMRVWGWKLSSDGVLYIPILLAQWACVLSATAGVGSDTPSSSDKFCDSMTLTYGNELADCLTSSAGAGTNLVASCLVDAKGCPLVEVVFNIGTATNANAMYGVL